MTDTTSLAYKAGQVQIGRFKVNRLGLGTNRITDSNETRALLKEAIKLGVNFIDTAHTYQNGASEITIGRTLAPYPEELLIATKGGMNGASPVQLRADLEDSLQRLKTDSIDLYQLHRVDPNVPLETTLMVIKQFQDEGKIHHVGLSEVNIEQIELANTIVPIVSVQNEYNLAQRHHESTLDYCTKHGIIFIPWFPLGGLRGDAARVNTMAQDIAKKYKATTQQISLAWLLARSPVVLPIPGTLSIEHLISNMQAALIHLSQVDYQNLHSM